MSPRAAAQVAVLLAVLVTEAATAAVEAVAGEGPTLDTSAWV